MAETSPTSRSTIAVYFATKHYTRVDLDVISRLKADPKFSVILFEFTSSETGEECMNVFIKIGFWRRVATLLGFVYDVFAGLRAAVKKEGPSIVGRYTITPNEVSLQTYTVPWTTNSPYKTPTKSPWEVATPRTPMRSPLCSKNVTGMMALVQVPGNTQSCFLVEYHPPQLFLSITRRADSRSILSIYFIASLRSAHCNTSSWNFYE